MARIIIDAGHGGTRPVGNSSALGARSPAGLAEKEVTLDIARAVVRRLGGAAALTRSGDDNLSLGARAAVAVQHAADVFVSIHANSGPPGASGPETWIHADAGASSRALSAGIQRALDRLAGRLGGNGDARRGPMAVLSPAVLGGRIDACLVEVDYLSCPRGAERLGDPRHRAAIGAAIADAIRAHLGGRLGDGDGDDDSQFAIDGPIPDDSAPDTGLAYPGALQAPAPQYPGASRFLEARAGHFRVPATPRTIDRIVIHITDGTTTAGATSWFRSPANTGHTSAHYVVGRDGEVVQMVLHENVAYHAGAANGTSIGIEHVALSPGTARARSTPARPLTAQPPTDEEYRASAALVAYLLRQYNIPRDRAHILGHSEAAPTTHTACPNSVWDWDLYMRYVEQAATADQGAPSSDRGYGDYPEPPSDRAYA